MTKHHLKLAIGIVVIVAAVAYLMFSGTTETTVYYLTIPEVHKRFATLQGEPIRISGEVTNDPIQWDVRNLSLAFVISEGKERLPVRYKGVKPDMFQPGVKVIVEGRLGADGVLVASNLMTSCPSKYQEDKGPTS
jgi:cytochrome c-type biogenesis protein CcmE